MKTDAKGWDDLRQFNHESLLSQSDQLGEGLVRDKKI